MLTFHHNYLYLEVSTLVFQVGLWFEMFLKISLNGFTRQLTETLFRVGGGNLKFKLLRHFSSL